MDIIQSGANKELIEDLIRQHLQKEESAEGSEYTTDRVFKRLNLEVKPVHIIRKKPAFRAWVGAAAAAAIVIVLSIILWNVNPSEKQGLSSVVEQDLPPGGNRATLVLGDGSELVLSDMEVGNIAMQDGSVIKKTADGKLEYLSGSQLKKQRDLNTIKTPKGGQYQVMLPDGSRVWLNAASSLTYPASFGNMDRQVKLEGEAYFEITTRFVGQKKQPFIVETGKQKIEVLGTRFNVNAYDDEAGIKTTLVEGKVKVITENETIILKPNQEFNLRPDGVNTQQVDVEPAIDWKNGDFIFAEENIKSVMRKIARWYNVEVAYNDSSIPGEFISGQISRNRNLSEVLRMLELSGNLRFEMKEGVIQIYHNQ